MKEWVKMPSKFLMNIEESPFNTMTWTGTDKSNYIAALMVYIVLVHHVSDHTSRTGGTLGTVSLSYDKLCALVGISRTKLSNGLKVLVNLNMIRRKVVGKTNLYTVVNYENFNGWAKLPAKGLYDKNLSVVTAFTSFKLRTKIELNALKIYLVFVAFRSNRTNHTQMSYEKITEYANVQRNDIKSALSLLVANKLIQVDSVTTELNEYSTSNVYRLCHLEVYKHRGTGALMEALG